MHWLRRLGPLGPLAFLSLAMPPVSGIVLIGTMHEVGPWLRANEAAGVVLYVAAFALLGGLALLPTYAQSLLGGWAFGFGPGLAAALVGFVGAAAVNYALATRLGGDRAAAMLAQRQRWHAVYRAMVHSGFASAATLVTLLRLLPNAPFAATNLAMAASKVPLWPFLAGTLVGLAPRTAAVVYVGAGLAELDFANRPRVGSFALGVLVTLGVVGALGLMALRALRRIDARDRHADDNRGEA